MCGQNKKDRLFEFLGKTVVNFERSKIAYNNYLKLGKTYIHARILKNCNGQIRNLLLENSFLLSDSLKEDALKLISHYDIWIEKWDDLKFRTNPNLTDEFIFQNEFAFPKEAEKSLINEFYELKREI